LNVMILEERCRKGTRKSRFARTKKEKTYFHLGAEKTSMPDIRGSEGGRKVSRKKEKRIALSFLETEEEEPPENLPWGRKRKKGRRFLACRQKVSVPSMCSKQERAFAFETRSSKKEGGRRRRSQSGLSKGAKLQDTLETEEVSYAYNEKGKRTSLHLDRWQIFCRQGGVEKKKRGGVSDVLPEEVRASSVANLERGGRISLPFAYLWERGGKGGKRDLYFIVY